MSYWPGGRGSTRCSVTYRPSGMCWKEYYALAGRASGSRPSRILFAGILPNCLTPIIVQGTLGIGTAILDAAALEFLGLGAQATLARMGTMLGRAQQVFFSAPHIGIFPGIAILLTVLGFNLLGDGMRDALDPRLKD